MHYLGELGIFRSLADEVIKPRNINYTEDPLNSTLFNKPHLQRQDLKIPNEQGFLLTSTLVCNQKSNGHCIIYAHGLGSNRLEFIPILEHLKAGQSVLGFDFSGCGKSKGEYVGYGNKEKHDIASVIEYLKTHLNYRTFTLWGRSMGAAACLSYCLNYKHEHIEYLVLDSIFCQFQKVLAEFAHRKVQLPLFLIKIVLSALKGQFVKLPANPYYVDFTAQNRLNKCKLPCTFIYSKQDSVVNAQHSETVLQNYKGDKSLLLIKQDHNDVRSNQTISKVLGQIELARAANVPRLRISSAYTKKGINLCGATSLKRILTDVTNENLMTVANRSVSPFHDGGMGKLQPSTPMDKSRTPSREPIQLQRSLQKSHHRFSSWSRQQIEETLGGEQLRISKVKKIVVGYRSPVYGLFRAS